MKVIYIVGARPNMMKVAPLMEANKKYRRIKPVLLHTGQHYDEGMSGAFFDDLDLPEPDIYLGVGSASHARQTSRIMTRLEEVLLKKKPDLVIVVGDVNSTMAAAITASKLNIPVAHVEAGLRSFDRTMPEEINRIVTDSVSDYLFAPSPDAVENLKSEGIPKSKIFFVGNVMIDTLLKFKKRARGSAILKDLSLKRKGYIVLTLHRPCNVDRKGTLSLILSALEEIEKRIKIVFPAHPRTKKMLKKHGLLKRVSGMKNFLMISPRGYLDFLALLSGARVVLTDSGGIQEETTVLNIPCITLRETTERPLTVTEGTNTLVGSDRKKIIKRTFSLLRSGARQGKVPKFWDGKTAARIMRIISNRSV